MRKHLVFWLALVLLLLSVTLTALASDAETCFGGSPDGNHNFVWVQSEELCIYYRKCTYCDMIFGSKTDHTLGEWQTAEQPSCSSTGLRVRNCTVCHQTVESESIPATGHSYSDWQVVSNPTCFTPGYKQRDCTVCHQALEEESIPATGNHVWGEWEVTKPASCTETGIKTHACTTTDKKLGRCTATQTESIPATGHSYGNWSTVEAATCVKEGKQERSCSVCGNKQTQAIAATGKHTFGEWKITQNATCVADGKQERSCSVCGTKESQAIKATGKHTFGEWKTTQNATCVADGKQERVCSVCGAKESQAIKATGKHTFGEWKTIQSATCVADGKQERSCSVCGAKESQAIKATGEHKWGAWTVSKAATCTQAGEEKRVCANCGVQETRAGAAAKGHNWGEWIVISELTADRDGEKQHTCSRCNRVETKAVYEEDGILKEGDTGDEVLVLQKMLKDIGLASDTKGTFNKNTASGVRELQKNNDMPVSGVATRPTRVLLSRVWQEARGIPLFSAQNTLGGRKGALSGRTIWISNGDGTHTKYSLGRKGITKACQCELNELSDGTLVYTCPLCHYSYAVMMINGKAYNASLVARTGEWQSNRDGTHSRDVWVLETEGTVRMRKIHENAPCTSDSEPDADHGTYCKECHGYYQYPDHDTVLLSSEPDSQCGWTREIWYCNDCGIQFNEYLETGEHCKDFKITAVTQYPGDTFYTAACTKCGYMMHEIDRDSLLEQGTVDCMHDNHSAMISMSGECGDLHKQMICSSCGENYTLIDRTNLDGCPGSLDGFLGYSEENERVLGCLRCGKVYTRIPMSDEEVAANGDICPGRPEYPRTHHFVRNDEQCFADCNFAYEYWYCEYCGTEDFFVEEHDEHSSTDALLTDQCGLKEWGCPTCGEVFRTEEGEECEIKDALLDIAFSQDKQTLVMRFGCPVCKRNWKEVPLEEIGEIGTEPLNEETSPCTSETGHDWAPVEERKIEYCTHTDELQVCTICGVERHQLTQTGNQHSGTDAILYSTCEKQWLGCLECGCILSVQETGEACTRDAILYTKAEEIDGIPVTCYILGCPVCGEEYGLIDTSVIPDDEWSEWTYDGCGSHSRYWLKKPEVIQRRGCTRINESYATCDTCGGLYIESGIALASHPIKLWGETEVICEIPTGATYIVIENSDSPYVEYNGIRGHISWQDISGLISVPMEPCTNPLGHDWEPVENSEPVRNCTDIQTFCQCAYCGATRWIIENTGREHPRTDAILHSPCYETRVGCPECGQIISKTGSGRDCEIKDAFLMIDSTNETAYIGCPVCNLIYNRVDMDTLDNDAWSPWVCSGNGTHSRYVKDYPGIVVTEPCYPGDEAETVCGLCGGTYINRGVCVAKENIVIFSSPKHMDDDQWWPSIIGVIPKGATFYVTCNGDYAMVEYDSLIGYIVGSQVNFVDEEKCEDCAVKDACLAIDPDTRVASLGCPVCNTVYSTLNLYTLGGDAWSAWACDGNGNHSHYVIGNPTIVEVMNCYPGEDETVCGLCGGPFIHSGACVALEDTELLSTLDHRNDELRKSTVICVIPRGATYHILYNGDFPVVEYDGLVGYIAGRQVNFVDEEKCEDCAVKDACLAIDPDTRVAYLGCPVCKTVHDKLNLYTLGDDAWSAWACDGNGNHSHYVIGNPTIVEVMNCYPSEDETVCGLCGGAYIHSGTCVALEDTELLSTLDHRNDELRESTVICVIPRGATFFVTSNGDFATVEYNGQTGYISGACVNFVVDEEN